MMHSISSSPSRPNRSGLTIVEVLIVLGCGLLLLMLAVPYVMQLRESQRTIACQNRIRSLGLGFSRYAEDYQTRFPPLETEGLPWTVRLLPYLEHAELQLQSLTDEPIEQQEPILAPQFVCPNGSEYPPGKNCYLVNGGWGNFAIDSAGHVTEPTPHSTRTDLDQDGEVTVQEQKLSRASGVIWRPELSNFSWSLDEIESGDGLSQTFLLSETQAAGSWMSLQTFDLAFVVGLEQITWGEAPDLFDIECSSLGPFGINRLRDDQESHSPAPSSWHPGGVNFLFADGAFRMISEQIEPLLFLRMMTPGGTQFGESRFPQKKADQPSPIFTKKERSSTDDRSRSQLD